MSAPIFKAGINLNSKVASNAADPSAATDLATKQYVDNMLAGIASKRYVRLKSTGNLAVATALAAGQTIDGKTVVAGDRIFLGSQTTGSENGIYIAPASGAASRATDFDTGTEIPGALIIVNEGTANGDTMWLETTDGPITIGTTALAFTQFTTGITYTADGNGIELSAGTFSLELDGSSLSKSSTGLRIGTAAGGAGLVVNAGTGVISVGAGTGITVNADDVAVDTSVVVRKYAANCAATTNPQAFAHGLGIDVEVQVIEVSTGEQVYCGVTTTSAASGTTTVDFGGAPTASQYRIIVQG